MLVVFLLLATAVLGQQCDRLPFVADYPCPEYLETTPVTSTSFNQELSATFSALARDEAIGPACNETVRHMLCAMSNPACLANSNDRAREVYRVCKPLCEQQYAACLANVLQSVDSRGVNRTDFSDGFGSFRNICNATTGGGVPLVETDPSAPCWDFYTLSVANSAGKATTNGGGDDEGGAVSLTVTLAGLGAAVLLVV